MEINWLAVLVAALVPTAVGFLWYNVLFGKVWMTEAGMSPEKIKSGNMPLIFGLSFLFSLMLSVSMLSNTIHQFGFFSILMDEPGFQDPGSEVNAYFTAFMEQYGTKFRSFGHGAVHGVIAGLFIALPILATNAMFERKSFKYVAVNGGYWIVTLMIMGSIICGWI